MPGFDVTLRFARALKFRWTKDTFFTERNGSAGNKPFKGSPVSNRFESKVHAGETPHSFREGLSKTLRLLGCSQEDVAQYLASGEVAKRYMQRSVSYASRSILENVFPRMASDLVTPVIHPDNLETAVEITLKCTYDGLGFLSNARDNV